jgi:hypothetical protein
MSKDAACQYTYLPSTKTNKPKNRNSNSGTEQATQRPRPALSWTPALSQCLAQQGSPSQHPALCLADQGCQLYICNLNKFGWVRQAHECIPSESSEEIPGDHGHHYGPGRNLRNTASFVPRGLPCSSVPTHSCAWLIKWPGNLSVALLLISSKSKDFALEFNSICLLQTAENKCSEKLAN